MSSIIASLPHSVKKFDQALPVKRTSVGDKSLLGNITKSQSAQLAVHPFDGFDHAALARIDRYALQAAARALLPDERVSMCHRVIVPGRSSVDVWHNPERRRAYYANLVSCGSVWLCPVCASKVAERRRLELGALLHAHPGGSCMVTVTLQHRRGDSLAALLAVLREAWSRTKSGRRWQSIKERFGVVGYVTALEISYGANGWHPHLHVCVVTEAALTDADLGRLQVMVSELYIEQVHKLGRYASEYHAIMVTGPDEVGRYVSKWGAASELTSGIKKASEGKHPFDLLRDSLAGDETARALFCEYAAAVKGKRQLCFSRGLRAALGLGPEVSDADAAVDQVSEGDALLARIGAAGWGVILANNLRGQLAAIASAGDAVGLASWLADYGIVSEPF